MNQMPTQIKEQGRTVRAGGPPICVVIIEDMREVREGLAALIDGTRGFACAGSHR
jgi:hypothetical protein